MGRAPCCEKVGLRRGRWTAEEDEKLINYIKQNGEGSWRSLPKNAGLLRCGKSCRLRWINYLRADLKRGNFTREEEETIINLHRSVGNKWSLIASKLPGRTDNEVKNYWNSHLSRKIYSFRSSDGSSVTTLDMVNMPSKSKRKGGRVSRAVAKKYSMHPITKAPPITTTTNETSSSSKISSTSGIQEATTAAQNALVGMVEATTHGVPESTAAAEKVSDDAAVGAVEESGKYQLQPMANNNYDYDESEGGCINSMHDIRCGDGGEGCARALLVPSPEKLEGEKGVAGPNDELDDVTLLLESVLESDLMDLSEISVHTGDTENESMYPESASINKDSDSGASNSNSDTGDGLYDCFAPLDSYFNHTWDAEYAVPGFGLWDQEDDDVLWPWES
ncbi:myb-related protein 330-like [Coffea eugenioides]|uniref:Uncharacterized protein isoform X2 n=1 Tax=Coffea arabica TaxID=13443 RepID=A0A6P6WWJ4_COFAR|nr:myb-related protein 330-like isoform X1 [Coffea arabica]XP_027164906.1 myb-related protein 330-like [Coffea eugenioides]